MSQNETATNKFSSPRKPRVVRTQAQWQSLIKDYENGSLTQKDFCDSHQIAHSSLHKWRKRYGRSKLVKPCKTPSFIDITQPLSDAKPQVENLNSTQSLWQVELELGQGVVLRVRAV